MDEYEEIAQTTRKKASKITLEQLKDLKDLYDDVIKDLAKKAKSSGDKSLTKRWVEDYRKQLMQSRKELRAEIKEQIISSTKEGAKLGSEGQQLILMEMFKDTDIELSPSFSNMFGQVNDKVVKDIINGKLYKDNKTLSDRIWNHSKEFDRDIQYTINKAMLEKKSAIELAKDLEKYVLDPAKRGSTWGACYPYLRHKRVDYNAMRLARTSINHSYQNSTIQSSQMNPFVEGIQWESSLSHGRTCELCRERHGQVYKKDSVPLDHPNGLCTLLYYIPKSLDEVATELNEWLHGGDNAKLDRWYKDHGEYFINKRI